MYNNLKEIMYLCVADQKNIEVMLPTKSVKSGLIEKKQLEFPGPQKNPRGKLNHPPISTVLNLVLASS